MRTVTLCILFATGIFFGLYSLDPAPGSDHSGKETAPPDMRWQLQRTADPVTGKVPSGAIMQAWHILRERGYYQQANYLRTEDLLDAWNPVNDKFPTLSVTGITYDPNNTQIFYFCTGEGWYNFDAVKGAGIFKSTDGGENWDQLIATDTTLFDYCQDILVHPLTSDIYVATRTGGLQRSQDGGLSWEKVLGFSVGSARNSICDIEFTADGGVFASIGIFETDGIYYSPSGDPGTFTKQTSGLPVSGYFRIEMATAPSDANVAYAIYCNSSDYKVKGVYKTTDKGLNWFTINTPEDNLEFAAKQAWYDLSLTVSPADADVVAMGGLHLWRTRDGGGSWERLSSGGLDSNVVRYVHVDQHTVVFKDQDEVYFGNDGGIWRTTNFTAEEPFIYERNSGYNVTQFYAGAIAPFSGDVRVMGGTQDNGTPFAYDAGLTDFKMVSGGDGAYVAFHTEDPDIFFTASQLRRMFRFNNGGFEFPDTITNPNLTDDNVLFINPFIMDASDPEVLFQCSNLGVWRLKNASVADTGGWQKAVAINGEVSALATSPAAPGVLFIGRNSGVGDIFRVDTAYTSGGATVPFNADPRDSLPDAPFTGQIYCSSITADVDDANHVIVTYSNFNTKSIWETYNALSADPVWNCIEGDLPDIPVYSVVIHPEYNNVKYIATEMGMFYTANTDGYNTQWIPCSNFPIVRTDMVRVRADGTLIAATHGRGIWEADLGLGTGGIFFDVHWSERGPNNVGGRTRAIMIDPNDPTGKTIWAGSVSGGLWKTTDIGTLPVQNLDQAGFTMQVYPNPANGWVIYHFSEIPEGQIAINLYDLHGRIVAQLNASPVNGTLYWQIPAYIASGHYLVEARSGKKKAVQSLIIH